MCVSQCIFESPPFEMLRDAALQKIATSSLSNFVTYTDKVKR